MKKLSEITLEDAKAILSGSYLCMNGNARWVISDESAILKEPCKKLSSKNNIFTFWFYDDSISVECEEIELSIHDSCFDAKYQCYIEAVKMGYYVTGLTEIYTQGKQEVDEDKLQQFIFNEIHAFDLGLSTQQDAYFAEQLAESLMRRYFANIQLKSE